MIKKQATFKHQSQKDHAVFPGKSNVNSGKGLKTETKTRLESMTK